MKQNLKLFVVMVLGLQSFAYAHNERGNGGIGYVCRDANNVITEARLLDLWEPETFTTIEDNIETMESQVKRALDKIRKLDARTAELLEKEINRLETITVETKKALPLTDDALPDFATERGCNYEQIARFGFSNEHNGSRLRIYKEIYNNRFFSNTDRAALKLHEAIYSLDSTKNAAQNSLKTRRITSRLFSEGGLPIEQKEELMELVESNESELLRRFNGAEKIRLKIYGSGPETTIKIKIDKSIVSNCLGKDIFYKLIDVNNGDDFEEVQVLGEFQEVVLKAGQKIKFSKSTCSYIEFDILDENAKDVTPLFIQEINYGSSSYKIPRDVPVEVIDLSK